MCVFGVVTSFPLTHRTHQARKPICIASPKTLRVSKLGTTLGYKHVESHFAYVHRTLTREIAVFQKEEDDET